MISLIFIVNINEIRPERKNMYANRCHGDAKHQKNKVKNKSTSCKRIVSNMKKNSFTVFNEEREFFL